MSNIHIALASRIAFNKAVWEYSAFHMYSEVAVEGERLFNLAAAIPGCDLYTFIDKVVFPYGDRLSSYMQQDRRASLHEMAKELGILAFAFCPGAHAAILQYTGYDAPRHMVGTDGGMLTLLTPDRSILGQIYGTDKAARELANKICTFLDTQP